MKRRINVTFEIEWFRNTEKYTIPHTNSCATNKSQTRVFYLYFIYIPHRMRKCGQKK